MPSLPDNYQVDLLARLGLSSSEPNEGVYDGRWSASGSVVEVLNPSTCARLASVRQASPGDLKRVLASSREAFLTWRETPAPRRGEIVRQIRDALSAKLDDLGQLVTLEMGKIASEGKGEVQEAVDVADYAVGLARNIGGTVHASERTRHFITEVANPLGVIGVITAFNFPVAVFAWNALIALVCGNTAVWKPSETTPLCAIATMRIINSVLETNGLPPVLGLACGGGEIGAALVDGDMDLISFTGSEARGREVGMRAAARFKQSILELGGNNAAVVMPDANIPLALCSIVFAALGTAGQRCTTTRRLFLHSSLASAFLPSLVSAYASASQRIGLPQDPATLIGPLHTRAAVDRYLAAVDCAVKQGGTVMFGGQLAAGQAEGHFVMPTIVYYPSLIGVDIINQETFAPILHVATFESLEEAIALNNSVDQGLSSALFTNDMANVFKWMGPGGSDCGIVNVNGSTSGAEVGARFGGNKSTGWGRECGGEAWKQYCRWSTCTVNFGNEVGLAQGVCFD